MTYNTKSKNLKERVNKIETTLQRRKPEIKHAYHNINHTALASGTLTNLIINNIGQGNTKYQRVGDEIRVTLVEVVLYCADSGMDAQIINPISSGNIPNISYYNPTIGSEMNPDMFKCYRAVTFNSAHQRCVRWRIPFRNTLRVQFNAGTAYPDHNGLYLCLHNESGGTADVEGFVRVWFTDV